MDKNLSRDLDRYIRAHYRPEAHQIKNFFGGMGSLFGMGRSSGDGVRTPDKFGVLHGYGGWSSGDAMRALDFVRNKMESSFSERLLQLMEQKGRKPAEVYIRVGITKTHFSKIKTGRDYHPTKETAFAFAIALYLKPDETEDLLKRAGYSISHSSERDLIVEFCIKREIYDIDEVNSLLDQRGHKPLTNWRKTKDE